MARALPWLISYTEDPQSAERYPEGSSRVVLRPIVEVSLVGASSMDEKVLALVDSGSEHVLASPGLARAIGLDVEDASWEMTLGLGGRPLRARFLDVDIRLHHPRDPFDEFIEWRTEVGFLDRQPQVPGLCCWGRLASSTGFTVTMNRHAQSLAIEPLEAFDRRYGQIVELAEYESIKRLRPP